MSKFGLLTIPVPLPTCDENPVSDPALRVLLDFLTAVINYSIGNAWRAVCPTDPVPIVQGYAEDPDLDNLDVQRLPALFGWRPASKDPKAKYSQGIVADATGFAFLWIPPPANLEDVRVRQPIRNGIKKSVQAALARGRHKAWKVKDDDYYGAQDRGSVLLHHLKVARITLDEFRPHVLKVETSENGRMKMQFDCLYFTTDCLELAEIGDIDEGVPHIANANELSLGPDATDLLPILSYEARTTIDEIAPASVGSAGGTLVTIRGTQFFPLMTVLFDAAAGTELTIVDDNTVTVRAPAHAAGDVDITIRGPGRPDIVFEDLFSYV